MMQNMLEITKIPLKALGAPLVAIGLLLVAPHMGVAQTTASAYPSGTATVIDGGSLRFGSVEVRLWGIQAPEWDTSAGAIAATFLRGLVWERDVTCWTFYHDKQGRAVAQCWVGRIDMARAMVDSGNAADWAYYSGGYYAQ